MVINMMLGWLPIAGGEESQRVCNRGGNYFVQVQSNTQHGVNTNCVVTIVQVHGWWYNVMRFDVGTGGGLGRTSQIPDD